MFNSTENNKKWKTTIVAQSWILKNQLFMLACIKNLCAKQVIGQTLITKPQLLSVKEAKQCLKTQSAALKSPNVSSLTQLQTLARNDFNKKQLQNASYEYVSKTHLKQQKHVSFFVARSKHDQNHKKNTLKIFFSKKNTLKSHLKMKPTILSNSFYNKIILIKLI